MRVSPVPFLAVALAACSPEVPNSAAGVGFDDYDTYREAREAELRGSPPPPVVPQGPVIGSETAGAVSAPVESAPAVATAPAGNSAISDEQSFDAVSARESIQSDAERLARNRQQYVVIQPTTLPTRPEDGSPNIVAYALATTNPVGTQLYSRGVTSQSRQQRECAKFPSPDFAQEAFLSRGGPEKDRLGLDPDGDGFACAWDPRPFRAVRGG